MTKEIAEMFLITAKFTFAKTMRNIPHSWICRKDFDSDLFVEVMQYIIENGKNSYFFSKEYTYLHIGEYKYWIMTDEKGFDDPTAIINRAKI
jgi:hypothetical protein